MPESEDGNNALEVRKGVPQPPSINPEIVSRLKKNRRKSYDASQFAEGILAGNRTILSQAITLLESSNPCHWEQSQEVIERCLPFSGKSVRIGITGVPGAGKSTFIETFGKQLTTAGKKLAVLAIDPSSTQTHGSILGDKTRMERLSVDPNAFIRPSPSSGTLGGVARKTRESIILCEAAGFDTVIVETVGVGQSEIAVSSMVDFFLLILIAGAGDELQGIKRGIVEMADAIAINKADGANLMAAERAASEYRNALTLFPHPPSAWLPRVYTCSASENRGISEIWDAVSEYVAITRASGYFTERRREQAVIRMHHFIEDRLRKHFNASDEIKKMLPEMENRLREGTITSYRAAWKLLNKFYGR
jgi:LAO/AO transport system kinase